MYYEKMYSAHSAKRNQLSGGECFINIVVYPKKNPLDWHYKRRLTLTKKIA